MGPPNRCLAFREDNPHRLPIGDLITKVKIFSLLYDWNTHPLGWEDISLVFQYKKA